MEHGDPKSHPSPPPVGAAEELEFDDPTLVRSVAPGQMAPADLERVAQLRVLKAMETCDGDQARAAQLLGVSGEALSDLLEKWNVPRPRKR
jgi:transcriptional regulator with AAA-type ATPase domain